MCAFKVHAEPLKHTTLEVYPAVGMHSKGEVVRLLDSKVWEADPTEITLDEDVSKSFTHNYFIKKNNASV